MCRPPQPHGGVVRFHDGVLRRLRASSEECHPLTAKGSRRKPGRLAGKHLGIRLRLGLSQNGLIRHLGLDEEL